MGKKKKRLVSVILAAVMLLIAAVPVQAGIGKAVYLSKTKLTLYVGDKTTLSMYVANTKTSAAGWSSGKKSVATVSKKGVVTAKKAGTAVIRCKTGFGYSLTCTVKVKKRTEMSSYLNKKYTKLLKKVPSAYRLTSDPTGEGNLYVFPDKSLFLRYNKSNGKISILQNSYSKKLSLYGVSLGEKSSAARKALKSKGWKYVKTTSATSGSNITYKKSGHKITLFIRSGKVYCYQWER